jgi:hypothetical protein
MKFLVAMIMILVGAQCLGARVDKVDIAGENIIMVVAV